MMRPYIRRRRNRMSTAEISLTPLIDTALTLLIIFMIATPMMHNSIKINLPEGNAKESKATQEELVVYLTENGTMFFNGVPVTNENLVATIKHAMQSQTAEKPVFVKADGLVHYKKVIQIVDQLKLVGGIKYVALATKKA